MPHTQNYKTPMPAFEWDDAGTWHDLFHVHETDYESVHEHLYESEFAYRMANFDKALVLTERIIQSNDQDPVIVSALCTHMFAAMATGDVDAAYDDLRIIKRMCESGLSDRGNASMYSTSFVCAMRIESVLVGRLFDIPSIDEGIESAPSGLKAYLGYLLALREIRRGNPERACGIAYAFRKIIGIHHPLSGIGLRLLMAATYMIEHEPEKARKEYIDAYALSSRYNIITPFVELNFLLLGLPRRCNDVVGDSVYKRIEAYVRDYREGWYKLRAKCGVVNDFGAALTPLESYALALAALGWRNKEIAVQLSISENTVKHKLTAVYQKIGASSRAEARDMAINSMTERELVVL